MPVFLVSDLHLGADTPMHSSVQRLQGFETFVKTHVLPERGTLILLGDMLDFGFAWRRVLPRKAMPFLALLQQIQNHRIPIVWIGGNHDQWLISYLQEETSIYAQEVPVILQAGPWKFYLEHGDLALSTRGVTRWIHHVGFRSPILRKIFRSLLHPDFSIRLAEKWSHTSRLAQTLSRELQEHLHARLVQYIRETLQRQQTIQANFYVFGHIHHPCCIRLSPHSWYVNTGDWLQHFSWVRIGEDGIPVLFQKNLPSFFQPNPNPEE